MALEKLLDQLVAGAKHISIELLEIPNRYKLYLYKDFLDNVRFLASSLDVTPTAEVFIPDSDRGYSYMYHAKQNTHIVIHTFPQYGVMLGDVMYIGDAPIEEFVRLFIFHYRANYLNVKLMYRKLNNNDELGIKDVFDVPRLREVLQIHNYEIINEHALGSTFYRFYAKQLKFEDLEIIPPD